MTAVTEEQVGHPSGRRILVVTSYVLLGATLCWSRLVRLGQPLWSDEIQTVTRFVRGGPREILAGTYVANNHELYSLVTWVTTQVAGESEIALRLWSVVPFFVGVAIVTYWLHIRLGALTGLLYLFLATASPLLLDLSRQARGYGLAYLAMSIVIVAALEADRSPRTWTIVAFCAAGVAGTLTLPHFAVAFFTIGVALLSRPRLRLPIAAGLALAAAVILVWYLPHLRPILETAGQDYGRAIDTRWLATAPLDETLVPAFTIADDALLRPNLASLLFVAVLIPLLAASPLLRARAPALILCSGVLATILAVWVTDAQVVPRFFSFLLVPLFVLLASGIAAILTPTVRAPRLRLVLPVAMILAIAFSFTSLAAKVARMPRESLGAVASTIRAEAPASTPVYAQIRYADDLLYHVGRPIVRVRTAADVAAMCSGRSPLFFVRYRLLLTPLEVTCTGRPNARHWRFDQYARGGRADLWYIPSASHR